MLNPPPRNKKLVCLLGTVLCRTYSLGVEGEKTLICISLHFTYLREHRHVKGSITSINCCPHISMGLLFHAVRSWHLKQVSSSSSSSSLYHFLGALAMEALHRQVLPFLLRRLKEDVLQDLPPKIIQDYYCELSPLQVGLCTLSFEITMLYFISWISSSIFE